ncbi:MAG: hydantoinase/oxoprolinase family protein [Desulfobulbus sp.]|jgi:N-methylhydantoinase A/oxoprolinase/acetone carboxylase beta subunit|uniref:hydantoinase/oxoprolinase family protein n=1 Tax=Desulfobulbus sp. TaxID=895 RepID=UPI00284271A8|nr:hydantoinase/oxoprolinase family protein [Desulfobulbus sp.]MDR2551028.1 hydantoinase/oxoprolinase family protein [Desulfobulbus sp.]
MRIGIDIGGTHTDGVLLDGNRLVAAAKVPTHHDNLLESINQVLQAILVGQDPVRVQTLNLSTTLTTNAIVTGKTEPVGMLVSAGPGIAPNHYRIGDHYHLVYGSLDHLGTETSAVDEQDLEEAVAACRDQGVKCFGVASKFSPRNPAHENLMIEALAGHADFISCGHLLSGQLNFGRRIHTLYYNSAVWRTFRAFAAALAASLKGFQLQAEVNILKADGGTMPLARALEMPVQSIFSGPAASVMGILATTRTDQDLIVLDIGGTTTDIAVFAGGQPLLEREGIAIEKRPTLVRAIRVESIGIGGDSLIRVDEGRVTVGPQRIGPCMATGGPAPSLMDAFNIAGMAAFGDVDRSRQGLAALAAEHRLVPEQLAQAAIEAALDTLAAKINALVGEINTKPVYTIHEILTDREIVPARLIAIGGPAAVFKQLLADRLGLEVNVPPLYEVANAIGAALTRTTSHLSLTVDTARGRLSVPMLGIFRPIARGYTLQEATAEAQKLLAADLNQAGVGMPADEIQITQADAFNMVDGGYTSGKNIRVEAQVRPAVVGRLEDGAAAIRIAGPA